MIKSYLEIVIYLTDEKSKHPWNNITMTVTNKYASMYTNSSRVSTETTDQYTSRSQTKHHHCLFA